MCDFRVPPNDHIIAFISAPRVTTLIAAVYSHCRPQSCCLMLFHLISQVQHVRDDSKGSSSGGNGKKKPIVTTGKFCEQKFCSFIQKEEGGRMEGKKKESVAFSREKIMAGVQKIQGLPCAFIFPKIILITFPSNCHRHTCEGLLPVKSRSQRVHKFLSVFGCCCYHRSGH